MFSYNDCVIHFVLYCLFEAEKLNVVKCSEVVLEVTTLHTLSVRLMIAL